MTTMTEVKPFPVVSGKYLFYFTPADEGGFSVTCQNVFGVNAQGDTFEEALADAMSCAAFVEECHRDFFGQNAAPASPPATRRKRVRI